MYVDPSGQLHGHEASHINSPHRGHAVHEGAHDKHAGHSVEMFRNKFWLSLALTIPTVVWGHMLMRLTGYQPPAFPGSQWIAPVFGTAVFLYGGRLFLQVVVGEGAAIDPTDSKVTRAHTALVVGRLARPVFVRPASGWSSSRNTAT